MEICSIFVLSSSYYWGDLTRIRSIISAILILHQVRLSGSCLLWLMGHQRKPVQTFLANYLFNIHSSILLSLLVDTRGCNNRLYQQFSEKKKTSINSVLIHCNWLCLSRMFLLRLYKIIQENVKDNTNNTCVHILEEHLRIIIALKTTS